MKRIFSCIFALAIFLCSSTNIHAAEKVADSHFFNDSTDYQTLLKQARNGAYESAGDAYLVSPNGDFVYSIDVYAIPNLETNGSITYLACTEDAFLETQQSRASYTDEKWDNTTSVLFSMTVNYNKNSSNYICLSNVSGSYSIKQSGVSVTNQSLQYVQNNPYVGVNDYATRYPTSSSFSYNTGFSNYVPDDNSTLSFGAVWNATIKRGGSSWSFSFPSYKYLF